MEPVESFPPSPDMRGEWGHLGPFDFGVGTRNLDVAARSVELVAEPFTVDLGDGATLALRLLRRSRRHLRLPV